RGRQRRPDRLRDSHARTAPFRPALFLGLVWLKNDKSIKGLPQLRKNLRRAGVAGRSRLLERLAVAAVDEHRPAQIGDFLLAKEDRFHAALPPALALDASHPVRERDRM